MQHVRPFSTHEARNGAFYGDDSLKREALQRLESYPATHYISKCYATPVSRLKRLCGFYDARCMMAVIADSNKSVQIFDVLNVRYHLPTLLVNQLIEIYDVASDEMPQADLKDLAIELVGAIPVGIHAMKVARAYFKLPNRNKLEMLRLLSEPRFMPVQRTQDLGPSVFAHRFEFA
jgi:hypothetical protein